MITGFFLQMVSILMVVPALVLPSIPFPSGFITALATVWGIANEFTFLFPLTTLVTCVGIGIAYWIALWLLDVILYALRYARGD